MRRIKRQIMTLALAVLCTPTHAATVFSDGFEDDTLFGNPQINLPLPTTSGLDVGLSWDNSIPGGVDVVANPVVLGNLSSKVYQPFDVGSMDGNFTNGILFDGATISMDFLLMTGANARKIEIGMQTADANSPAEPADGLNFSPFAIK